MHIFVNDLPYSRYGEQPNTLKEDKYDKLLKAMGIILSKDHQLFLLHPLRIQDLNLSRRKLLLVYS